jgi:hypothetical protein
VRDDRDRGRGHEHEPDRVQADPAQVRPQVAQRREVGRVEQERRQEDQEDEIRVELDLRHAGHEPDKAPGHHQQDRVGDPERAGQHRHRGDGHEQEQDYELDVLHQGEATSRASAAS